MWVPWAHPDFAPQAARGGAEVVAAAREREAGLLNTIAELRATLTRREEEAADREEALRRQCGRLEERIRQLEVGAGQRGTSWALSGRG